MGGRPAQTPLTSIQEKHLTEAAFALVVGGAAIVAPNVTNA